MPQKNHYKELYENETDKLKEIACNAAYVSGMSKILLLDKLEKIHSLDLYTDIERPLAITLFHMEKEGIIADKESLETYSMQLGEQIDKLQKQIHELAGEEFNINSPKQLGEILFEKLKLPNGKKTKTGYSTSAEVFVSELKVCT